MACMMASDKASGPLLPPQINQKRRSLPGPVPPLNLYATHQQRRLSERGLLNYRPSKPDIDLIGDFLNPKKPSAAAPSIPSPTSASGSTSSTFLPSIASSPSQQTSPNRSGGSGNESPGSSSKDSSIITTVAQTHEQSLAQTAGSAGRKVVLRIQKNPITKEKLMEFKAMESGSSSSSAGSRKIPPSSRNYDSDEDLENCLLHQPSLDSRRFSDSVATRAPPKINVTQDSTLDSGIVCTTGDLLTLKCLTSSAQEIRFYSSPYGSYSSGSNGGSPIEDRIGNRSRSFDATYSGGSASRKGAGSSWFSRRHLPISVKLPLPVKSPSIPNSPGPGQTKFQTPSLIVTNENTGSSEIIEIPSPPAVSPASPACSDPNEEKTKVTWEKGGFVLDASVLGFAIENHLRKIDMGRRATVTTLYHPDPIEEEEPPPSMRMRSASAIVIPSQVNSGGGSGATSPIGNAARSILSSDLFRPINAAANFTKNAAAGCRNVKPPSSWGPSGGAGASAKSTSSGRRMSLATTTVSSSSTSKFPTSPNYERNRLPSFSVPRDRKGSFSQSLATSIKKQVDSIGNSINDATNLSVSSFTGGGSSPSGSRSPNRSPSPARRASYVETIKGKVKVTSKSSPHHHRSFIPSRFTSSSSSSSTSAASTSRSFTQILHDQMSSVGLVEKTPPPKRNEGNIGKNFLRRASHSPSGSSRNAASSGANAGLSICSSIRDFIVHSLKP